MLAQNYQVIFFSILILRYRDIEIQNLHLDTEVLHLNKDLIVYMCMLFGLSFNRINLFFADNKIYVIFVNKTFLIISN